MQTGKKAGKLVVTRTMYCDRFSSSDTITQKAVISLVSHSLGASIDGVSYADNEAQTNTDETSTWGGGGGGSG